MSSKADIFIPINIGDYLKDTMHLDATEHGGYLLMIFHYWMHGPIKNDKKTIKNISKISAKKSEKIIAFFQQENGFLVHKRIDKEKEKAIKNQEVNKNRAIKAANKLWENKRISKDAPSIAQAVLDECQSTTTTTKEVYNKSLLEAAREAKSVDNFFDGVDFDDPMIWTEFFKKVYLRTHLAPIEQETIRSWCTLYDMSKVFEVIEHELSKFRQRNNGKNPDTVMYFDKALAAIPSLQKGYIEERRMSVFPIS